jgi:UDP-3-O-[3-hydroxymyristoyl] N-acetylglucosamine deacetylase
MIDAHTPPVAASIRQHTLARKLQWRGKLAAGEAVALALHPAEPGSGIRIRRLRMVAKRAVVPVRWDRASVADSVLTLANDAGVNVQGVTTLLAALRALGVDNALVEVSGRELPAGLPDYFSYLEQCADAGVVAQGEPRMAWRVAQTVEVRDSIGFAGFSPAPEFCVRLGVTSANRAGEGLLVSGALASDLLEPASGWPHHSGPRRGGHPPLWDVRALPPLLRARTIDVVGHMTLAGAPLLGYLRTYRASPGLHHSLLRALMLRNAATLVTVDSLQSEPRHNDDTDADADLPWITRAATDEYYH